ncbi:hypothetical protein [Parvibaculum sp.]|uniref:hypothetical protein n=1 Tax=Parvibaculum sp. TaxID=2024848 RepID=UPI001D82129F|nr:hypothetical protein [Parvibaculum sp.]MBX3488908.1 hypothetical protein [Parvibaculum sp.]
MSVNPELIDVGDIVTRDGTDEHRVIWMQVPPGMPIEHCDFFEVVCIKAPATAWCKVGEKEKNMLRRYSLVRRAATIDASAAPARLEVRSAASRASEVPHREPKP